MATATLRIGASTSEFNAAMKQVNQELKTLDSSIKTAGTQASLGSNKLQGLQQQQTALKQKTETYTTAIKNQQTAQQTYQNTISTLKDKQAALGSEIDETKKYLVESVKQFGANSDSSKELAEHLKDLETQQSNVQKSIDSNNSKLETAIQKENAYTSELLETEEALKKVNNQVTGFQADKIATSLGTMSSKLGSIGKTMTAAVTTPIAALGTMAVKTAAEFESSLSQVQATMGITKDATAQLNGETVNIMDSLESLASKMGAETKFSAVQCADALNYLALAGYDLQETYDTLPTVLNLAAAGDMDLASASDMVTDAMSALGLETEDAKTMVDQMAKTASSSNTSVAQLGEGMLTVGGTAKTLKGGTTELSTALGILADNGIKGAEGGTKLRNIILSLTAPTEKAGAKLQELGVSVYDADGNMRPLNDTLGDLNGALSSLSGEDRQNAISTIFNKADLKGVNALLANVTDGFAGANEALEQCGVQWDKYSDKVWAADGAVEGVVGDIVYNLGVCGSSMEEIQDYLVNEYEIDADDALVMIQSVSDSVDDQGSRWDDLTKSIDDSTGAAQQMADTQLDNLEGQITILQSGFEGLFVSLGKLLIPTIKDVVSKIQSVVDWLNGLDEGTKKTIVNVGLFLAAIGPVSGILSGITGAASKVVSGLFGSQGIFTLLKTGSTTIGELFTSMTGLSAGALPIIGIIAAVGAVLAACYANSETFRNSLSTLAESTMGALQQAFEAITPLIDAFKGAFEQVAASLSPYFQFLGDLLGNTIIPMITGFLSWIIPTIGEVLGAISPFITAIGDFLSGVLEVGAAVISLITGDFSGCWEHLTNAASSAFDGIKNVFGGIWEVGSTIVVDLWNGLTSGVEWLWTNISTWGQDVWQNIKDGIGDIAEIGKAIVDGIWNGISGKWEDFKTNLGNFATGIGDKVKEVLGIHSPSTVFEQLGGFLNEGLANGIGDDQAILSKVQELCEKISIAFQSGLTSVKESVNAMLSNLITADSFDMSGVVVAIDNMVNTIRAEVEQLRGVFDEIFSGLRDNSIQQVQLLYNQATTLYTSLAETTASVLQTMGTQVVTLFNAMTNSTINAATQMQSSVITTMQTMATQCMQAVQNMHKQILSALYTFAVQFASQWSQIYNTTLGVVTQMKTAVVAQIGSMSTQIMSIMNALPSQFSSVGVSMMSELISGMKSKEQEVLDTASALTKSLVDTFKKGLGIHSPSRVVRDEIGAMVLAGLIQGMSEEDMIKFVEKYVGDLQSSFADGNLYIGTLIDTLDDDGAKALIEYLNEIDGTEATASASAVFPLPGSLSDYVVTSVFGNRTPPTAGASSNHGGTDIAAASGTPIYAAGSGTVSLAGSYGGYGNCVIVDHGNGFQTLYGHMSSIATSSGSSVKAGQTIGYVGSTGVSTGDHLHFETRQDGTAVDSYPYLEGAAIAGNTLASAIQNALTLKGRGTSTAAINAMGSNVILATSTGSSSMSAADLAAYRTYSGTVSADQVTEWIKQACTITGESLSSVPYLLAAAWGESRYDPGSINDWDENATVYGTPSIGLMQVIQPTFDSFKAAGYDNIWDPVSNIAAAIGWMRYKYGSVLECCLPRMDHWYGYSVGSRYIPFDQIAQVHAGELIIPKSENPYANSSGSIIAPMVREIMGETLNQAASNSKTIEAGDTNYNLQIVIEGRKAELNERELATEIFRAIEKKGAVWNT